MSRISTYEKQAVIHGGTVDFRSKLIFVGAMDVGKSSIIQRFDGNKYPDTVPTIMCAFFCKTVTRNNEQIKMEIWDTAGQERFYSIAPLYFRTATHCILVFDLTDHDSFIAVEKWRQLCADANDDVQLSYFLVGNKSDKESTTVSDIEIHEYCKTHGIKKYVETSAYTGANISILEDAIIDDICEMKHINIYGMKVTVDDVPISNYCQC
jgi:Ras-related protein Rab-5C